MLKNSEYDIKNMISLGETKKHSLVASHHSILVINAFYKIPQQVEERIHGRNDHRSVIFHPFPPAERQH